MIKILTDTNPTLLFNTNSKRRRLIIQMQSTNVDGNNTGRIHIARGYQPVSTVGHNSQGEILMQSDVIDEPSGGNKMDQSWQGNIWATSTQPNQSLYVEEEVEGDEAKG